MTVFKKCSLSKKVNQHRHQWKGHNNSTPFLYLTKWCSIYHELGSSKVCDKIHQILAMVCLERNIVSWTVFHFIKNKKKLPLIHIHIQANRNKVLSTVKKKLFDKTLNIIIYQIQCTDKNWMPPLVCPLLNMLQKVLKVTLLNIFIGCTDV